jgi:phage-related protein
MSSVARQEAGFLLRRLQQGDALSMPVSRPMPSIGPRCHELRITDSNKIWRVVYRIDTEVILIAEIFRKTTNRTPKQVIDNCKRRLSDYDRTKGKP